MMMGSPPQASSGNKEHQQQGSTRGIGECASHFYPILHRPSLCSTTHMHWFANSPMCTPPSNGSLIRQFARRDSNQTQTKASLGVLAKDVVSRRVTRGFEGMLGDDTTVGKLQATSLARVVQIAKASQSYKARKHSNARRTV